MDRQKNIEIDNLVKYYYEALEDDIEYLFFKISNSNRDKIIEFAKKNRKIRKAIANIKNISNQLNKSEEYVIKEVSPFLYERIADGFFHIVINKIVDESERTK